MNGQRLRAVQRISRILWAALFVAAVGYLPIGLAARATLTLPSDPAPEIAIALAVLALGVAVLSFVLPARIFRNAVRASKLALGEEIDPAAMPGAYRDQAPKRRVFKTRAKVELAAANAGQTAFVLQAAMREAVVLFGLSLLFLGHAPMIWSPFFALGWILFVLAWPSPTAWLRRIERIYDARLPAPAEPSGAVQRASDAATAASDRVGS